MNVIILDGVMGAGKTLGAMLTAKHYQNKSGCTLYSNFGMKGAKPFHSFDDLLDVAKQPSSIVVLDEAHIDLDSRNYNTNVVKFFTHIVFYLRKIRCTLILTSPLFENIESRVRGVTNLYIHVTKDKEYFYYRFNDMQSMRYLKTKKIKQSKAFALASGLFDTYSMVTPIEYPEKREQFHQLLENLKAENAKYLVERQAETREACRQSEQQKAFEKEIKSLDVESNELLLV